ncbi:MAG: NAD(+)/NADH kinase [Clostridia bacterium]|nr:NAD(+)/NADH kinase [Clostridia bacterium]
MKLVFFTNPQKENAPELMEKLAEEAREKGFDTLSASTDEGLEELLSRGVSDLLCVVTIGGDGTVLRAVSSASEYGVPVLGVNMGRVGFFSEVDTGSFEEALGKLISGDYTVEHPSMLTCLLNGRPVGDCLNDFSVHRQELSSITQLELVIDGDTVGNVMADGLIVATPSGSTAYTMSAGGPVVAPKLDCILVTPICPHSLTVRPIVSSVDSVVEVTLKCACGLSGDGRQTAVLSPGDRLVFSRSERSASFIRFNKRNVFRLIREKLM